MNAEIAEGVRRLGTRWVNWYIVEDGARLTVVDARLPQYWDQLTAALAAMGRGISDVEAVVLTHNHFDHIGCAERVRAESGGAHTSIRLTPRSRAGTSGRSRCPAPSAWRGVSASSSGSPTSPARVDWTLPRSPRSPPSPTASSSTCPVARA
jgi:glyoxylase-like metal-dependent hydrolase (beta-lactamase superfamily II)